MVSPAKKSPVKDKSKPEKIIQNKKSEPGIGKVDDKLKGGIFGDRVDMSVTDLFFSEMKDMLWAENHLVVALPKMIDASTGQLKKALQDHLRETKTHVTRIEKAFQLAGKPALAKKCDAMEGLTMSGIPLKIQFRQALVA